MSWLADVASHSCATSASVIVSDGGDGGGDGGEGADGADGGGDGGGVPTTLPIWQEP